MKKFTFLIQLLLIAAFSATAQTVILTQDFESVPTATGITPPTGWTRTQGTPSVGFEFGNDVGSQYFTVPAHTKYACSNDDAHDNSAATANKANLDRLISPAMDLTAYTGAVLKFATVCPNIYGSIGTVEVSTNGGTTWTSIYTIPTTTDWTEYTISLNAYLASTTLQICFHHNDGGQWASGVAIDDVQIFQPAPIDLGLTQLSMNPFVLFNTNFNVTGTVKNFGIAPITSYDINYTINGGVPVVYNVTGVNIASFSTLNFTFPTPVNFPTTGERIFVVTITNINGSADPIVTNNSLTTTVGALSYVPVKRVMGEEGTGTWCGWCPRGAVYMEEMATTHPATWVGVAVHNGDPMVVTAYDAEMGNHISGYPSGLVDRQLTEVDPTDFGTAYTARVSQITPVEISITGIAYNSTSRVLDFTVQGVLAGDLNGNYRFNAVLTEDNVHGTASGYNQTNYYSSTQQNIALNGAGHNWQTSPSPVPAASMYYDHVARALLGGWSGTAGSIAATNAAGATISKSYTTTLNAAWNSSYVSIVGFIVNQTTGEIINACKSDFVTAVENQYQKDEMYIYPNPSTGIFYLKNSDPVNVAIYNILGQQVMSEYKTQMLNMSSLPAGTYTIRIENGKDVLVKRVVLTK